ncbi:anti-sigma factor family protein, partial [Xanthomonas oryzae]
MKDIDESTLLAYADGALTPDQAGRVEAVLAADPQRAADVRQLQQVKARLRNGYASVLEEPIPAHLLDAA